MKTKWLLLYGYLIPIATSLLISALPSLSGFMRYETISAFLANKAELLFAFLAVLGATTFPFQSAIINEDNPHVLEVLETSNVRIVFVRTSIIQAVMIAVLALLILVLSSIPVSSALYGWLELFAISLITFESIALISNGRSYSSIRERIIRAANKAMQEKSQRQ